MPKTFTLICTIALLLLVLPKTAGQDKRLIFLGIEGGLINYDCILPEPDFIRGDVPAYYYDDAGQSLHGYTYKWYTGLKTEVRSKNNKLGLLTGIRYSNVSSSLGKKNTWTTTSNFFYVRNQQNELTTEYLRVKEINQSSNYLGIPIEGRIFPFRPSFFNIFFKFATEFSFRINTKNDVVFFSENMNPYRQDILDLFDEPNNLYVSANMAGGLRIGRSNKTNINIEASLPSFILTETSTGLMNPEYGIGFQVNLLVPF